LWFEVCDTGCGIADEAIGRLFQGFEQADAGTTRRHGGTGLGLSISHRLSELMGGSLTATSIVAAGSKFRVELPLRLTRASDPARATETALSPTPTDISLLVAEDHPVNRQVLALLLAPTGWRLTFAEDGAQALDIAGREPFDAILMDMQMPVMDGLNATRAIRAAEGPNRTTPVLALTANALDHHRQAWADVGVDIYLTKPINPGELIAEVTRACAATIPSHPEFRVVAG
jgi:CheY-like chemotaxis protein